MTISPANKPSWGFITSHPAYFIAFGFGSGLSPWAPGTVGTWLAYPLYFCLIWLGCTREHILLIGVVLFLIGVKACEMVDQALGIHDHSGANFDEIVAMLFVLALTPPHFTAWLLAFIIFRLFDIAKPWPICWLDKHVNGGFGVMLDDMAAASATVGILYWLQSMSWL